MKKWVKKVSLGVAALAVLFFVLLFTLDLGFLQGPIERQATRILGRPVSFEQGLSLHLGTTTVIEVRGLRIGNPGGSGGGDLLQIRRLYVAIETATLWAAEPPTVLQLESEGVRVNLVEQDDGRRNWDFGTGRQAPEPGESRLPVLLQHARVEDVRVGLRHPRLKTPLDVTVNFIEQDLEAAGHALLKLNGQASGERIDFEGSVGPWSHLASGRDVTIQGQGGLGIGHFAIDAQIDQLWSPQRPEIRLTGNSPSLKHMTETLGLGDWGDGKVDINLQTKPEGDLWSVRLQAEIGPLKVELEGEANSLSDYERLALSGSASGQNLGRLAALAGYPGWPEQPFELEIDSQRNGSDLKVQRLNVIIAGARMQLQGHVPQLPSIAGATIDLDAEGERLEDFSAAADIGELPAGPFAIRGQAGTAGGGETRFDLDVRTGTAEGMIEGTVSDARHFDLTLDMNGPDLTALKRLQHLERLPPGPFRIDGQVTGDPTGTRFDLDVSTSPGAGHIRGFLLRDDRLDLQLDLAGQFASRLGAVLGFEGLPESPWQLLLDLHQPDLDTVAFRNLEFDTAGISLGLTGTLGIEAQSEATRLEARLEVDDASRLRAILPEWLNLREEAFSLRGRMAGAAPGWVLNDVYINLGTSTVQASGRVGAAPQYTGTDLNLSLSGEGLDQRFAAPEPLRVPGGPFLSRARLLLEETDIRIEGFELETDALQLKGGAQAPWPLDSLRGQVRLDGRGDDLSAVLPRLGRLDLADLPFTVAGQGRWDDGQFAVQAFSFTAGEAELTLEGTLDLPPDASATDLALKIRTPNLSRMGTLRGTGYGELPFELDAHLAGSATHMEFTRMQARLGDGLVSGLFSLDLQDVVPRFDLKLTTEALDFRPFLSGRNDGTDEPDKPKGDGRRIPDLPLPLSRLSRVNGSFVIAADRLTLRRSVLHNNVLNGSLENGELRISNMGTDTAGGRLTASLDVRPAGDGTATVGIAVHSKGLILDFSEAPHEQKAGKPPIDVDLDLVGQGATTRELAASLNGSFAIYSPGGVVSNDRLENDKRAPLAQIVNAVSPASLLQPEIKISCIAAVGQVRDGMVQLAPGLALQSEWVNTFADGTIDLTRERLDINIESRSRKLVTVSAGELVSPFVKVGGTLAKPSIGIDTKGALLTGGAAVLSGGLSLLAQKALGQIGREDPCGRILQSADPANAKR